MIFFLMNRDVLCYVRVFQTKDMGGGVNQDWLRSNVVLIPQEQSDIEWDAFLSSVLLPDSIAHKILEKQKIARLRNRKSYGKKTKRIYLM